MNSVRVAILLAACSLFGPGEARACHGPEDPTVLRGVQADAVVLAYVTGVAGGNSGWRATGRAWAILSGTVTGPEFGFSDASYVRCGGMRRPRVGRYVILYLRRSGAGMQVLDASAYWWARRSGDPRLAPLNALLPLGPVREPGPGEARMIALAEPRIRLPPGERDLSRYTRIYARASAGWVKVMLLLARAPRRLMVDDPAEMPTEESCGCTLIEQIVNLDDHWNAGRLPPFDP